DKADGTIRWTYTALGKIESSPVIAQNVVVITSGDGRIYLLNKNSGEKIWSYEIGSPISSTPAVVENMIVVGAVDGRVYAFGWPN
ncbi:MAG: PQQ-like beta-propeller repeat protein, partial [Bacteroidales bacterium]|nr:PQQ-like beta-propeller repeat protein [Bacteroidales bacterium]